MRPVIILKNDPLALPPCFTEHDRHRSYSNVEFYKYFYQRTDTQYILAISLVFKNQSFRRSSIQNLDLSLFLQHASRMYLTTNKTPTQKGQSYLLLFASLEKF